LLTQYEEATKKEYRLIWNAFMTYLGQHWLSILLLLLFLLLASAIVAFTTRRWAWFGSVLYNYLYFGALWLIGLMFGPEVFANDYFKIVLVLLYGLCFWLLGRILKKTGLRR
jgi:hypothetical protein